MRIVAAAFAFIALTAACAPRESTEEQAGPPGPRAIVQAVIDEQIIPDHAAFAEAAARQQEAVAALCSGPSDAALEAARARFGELVLAWSRIEWISFGPARENNRREALFFWPDSGGRGLRQAATLAAADDPAQFEPEAFADKSVAVKGLLAMELVLFGDGVEALTSEGAARCAYARAIADSIASTAGQLEASWIAEDGHRATMLEAGPDNPAYRNHREALQRMLTAASEQVQVARDLKLAPLLRERNGAPAPVPPPFSASGLGLAAIVQNIDAASAVFLDYAARLLPEGGALRANSLSFEVGTARRVLDELAASSMTPEDIARDDEMRRRLAYLLVPLGGAHDVMAQSFPADLGLIQGFNSLDGD